MPAVGAAPFLAAHVPAAVGDLAALPLGVGHFAFKQRRGGVISLSERSLLESVVVVVVGGSHRRSRCRRPGGWRRRSDRRDNASLQPSLREKRGVLDERAFRGGGHGGKLRVSEPSA